MTVKRYDPEGYDGLSALMREAEYGEWVSGEDYDALLSLNAELLEALESICTMQARNYGDATQTHLDLPELTDKARALIAKARSQS